MHTKLLVALAAVIALMATSASAHHDLNFSFAVDDNSAGANSDATWHVDYGTYHPASSTLHLPPGFLVAHADDNTSPLSPSPTDGEEVLDADVTAQWKALFCGSSTQDRDGEWVEPIDSGAPSDTVAQIDITGLGTTITMYVRYKSNGDDRVNDAHYDLYIPDHGDEACDGSEMSATFTLYGMTANGTKVLKNPCSEGTYTIWFDYTDQSGDPHSDSDTVAINGNC